MIGRFVRKVLRRGPMRFAGAMESVRRIRIALAALTVVTIVVLYLLISLSLLAFAGTGALGLEALSRGAAFALFVDDSAQARGIIRENVEALGAGGATRLFRRDAMIAAGGYLHDTVGEDMELVVRMHHYLRASGITFGVC
mgnify:CR=1 FL=1